MLEDCTKKPSDLFTDKMVEASRYKIMFVSDYHMAKEKAEKLKLWYLAQEKRDVTLVICGGDFDNLHQQSIHKTAENMESEARISAFLTFLEFFSCPIYYVPGNHDPPSMFLSEGLAGSAKFLTQHSHNVHLKLTPLAKGLSICGLGGCVPAKQTDLKTGEVKSVWEGYPYQEEAFMKPDADILQSLVDQSKDQIIFLTHCGPDIISTSLNVQSDVLINGGSSNVSTLYLKNREKFLMVLHGHLHAAQGMHRDKSCATINPGSLGQGNFCIIDIVFSEADGWQFESVKFVDLDSIQ